MQSREHRIIVDLKLPRRVSTKQARQIVDGLIKQGALTENVFALAAHRGIDLNMVKKTKFKVH